MQKIIAFSILSMVKSLSHVLFPGEFKWLGPKPENPWKHTRLLVLMNHTSLYEPIYIQGLSFPFLWNMSSRANVPGADITLKRPIVGRFWKLMVPNIAAVTRKKDSSWSDYLNSIKKDSIILIAPEGRMKRPSGFDKYGKPMTVRGGVADIIESLDDGGIVLCLSGGLHHIQKPGQRFPKIFKKIRMNFIYLDVKEYKAKFPGSARERKLSIVRDLQERLEKECPQLDME